MTSLTKRYKTDDYVCQRSRRRMKKIDKVNEVFCAFYTWYSTNKLLFNEAKASNAMFYKRRTVEDLKLRLRCYFLGLLLDEGQGWRPLDHVGNKLASTYSLSWSSKAIKHVKHSFTLNLNQVFNIYIDPLLCVLFETTIQEYKTLVPVYKFSAREAIF